MSCKLSALKINQAQTDFNLGVGSPVNWAGCPSFSEMDFSEPFLGFKETSMATPQDTLRAENRERRSVLQERRLL